MGMNQIGENIYSSNNLTPEKADNILNTIRESKNIAKSFWGEFESDPTIIICNSEKEFNAFGEYKSDALTRVYPFGTYIVISSGNINENIISHELTHAELYTCTGFINNYKIPEWFHEGLAVLSTEKDINSDSIKTKYDLATINGRLKISLDNFSFNEKYYGYKDKYDIYYVSSEMKVANWYIRNNRSEGLKTFITKMNRGESFYEAFKE